MKSALKFFARPIYRRYQDLIFRVSSLETAVDSLIVSPKWTNSDEIGFNGQRHRKLIFRDLMGTLDFDAIVETGTWIGDTTGYMAKTTGLPVYTCELDKRFHSIAKMRLQGFENVTFVLSDSRSFLKELARTEPGMKTVFVYLDAHWHEDLPLREELELICTGWEEFVILVDDFQVPGDEGYGYDDYGKGKALSLTLFPDIISKHALIPFFPAVPSSEETGKKRGCVVIVREGEVSAKLGSVPSLCRRDV
jgi:hypothetical protein